MLREKINNTDALRHRTTIERRQSNRRGLGDLSRENESARGQEKKSSRKPAAAETEEKSRADLVERNQEQQNSVNKSKTLPGWWHHETKSKQRENHWLVFSTMHRRHEPEHWTNEAHAHPDLAHTKRGKETTQQDMKT
jgi:hypothetical protein